ncbi:MAG: hydantoinase/oxoprolinase family protein [Desulfobacteraceae bacterium]
MPIKIIGIDVGGTHADGVLLEGNSIISKAKIVVNHDNLSETVINLLSRLLKNSPASDLGRVHLSSTLCTNAIACGQLDPVGMLVQAGPGMNPDFLQCGDFLRFLDGAIDHRGSIIKEPSMKQVYSFLDEFLDAGIESVGIVCKFSHRNPDIELKLAEKAEAMGFRHISCGSNISGLPNFPRRVYTTWINAALQNRFQSFARAVVEGAAELGITAPLSVLKADGGTMPLEKAIHLPCESIHSGPSASVMGALALSPLSDDYAVVDIGGTTTDIGLFISDQPLMEPYGVTVMGRPTLIRALATVSVGLGGNSKISIERDGYCIGPDNLGIPAAFSTGEIRGATLSDALVVEGSMEGNLERAEEALRLLHPEKKPQQVAEELAENFAASVRKAMDEMIEQAYTRPVYTVSAFLGRHRLNPAKVIAVGGPGGALKERLAQAFDRPCIVPPDFEVANAIGAARTRSTLSATLYANSGDGTLSIPEIGLREKIEQRFSMRDAEKKLTEAIDKLAKETKITGQYEIDFLEREEMNTVQGFSSTGKIISLKAQVRPGLEQAGGIK